MASPLKVPKDIHLASGASDKSQLAATGMQLKIIVQLHMMVKATRKTDFALVVGAPHICRPTYQSSQKHPLRLGLHETSQIESDRYFDKGDSIHIDQAVYEHQKQEVFRLIPIDVVDMPSDSGLRFFDP